MNLRHKIAVTLLMYKMTAVNFDTASSNRVGIANVSFQQLIIYY